MRILVPVDGSASSKRIIEFLGSRVSIPGEKPEIELLNVQYSIPEGIVQRFGMEAVKEVYESEGRRVFDALAPALEAAGLKCGKKVLYGEFGKAIAREADAFDADLIVMGTRGLSPIKSFFLGSVSNTTLQYTTRPMLLIRDVVPPVKANLRVAIAADGSDYAVAGARFIAKHHALFGADPTVAVVHVSPDFRSIVAGSEMDFVNPVNTPEIFAKEQEKLFRDATDPVIAELKKEGIAAEAVRLEGEPAESITAWAKDNADLIIMGSHGYGNFTAAVLGSTAMKIASSCELPILIVRH